MQLAEAPLRISTYFFTKTHVSLNEKTIGRYDNPDDLRDIESQDIDTAVEIHTPEETEASYEENGFYVHVQVKTTDDALESNIAIDFTISLMGKFFLPENLFTKMDTDAEFEAIIVKNCASILYGAIRDHLASITAKMPCEIIILPNASFKGISRKDDDGSPEKNEEAKRKTPAKGKGKSPKVKKSTI